MPYRRAVLTCLWLALSAGGLAAEEAEPLSLQGDAAKTEQALAASVDTVPPAVDPDYVPILHPSPMPVLKHLPPDTSPQAAEIRNQELGAAIGAMLQRN